MNTTPLPPAKRNDFTLTLASAPMDGMLRLQICDGCTTVQYPPRELCSNCLGTCLSWRRVEGAATVLASTALHHSHEAFFRERLPWTVASLKLDAGPIVFAHIEAELARSGARLRVANAHDASGAWCLVAFSMQGEAALTLDQTMNTLRINA